MYETISSLYLGERTLSLEKEAWFCFSSSDAGRGRGTAALVVPAKAVAMLQVADSQDTLLSSRVETNDPFTAFLPFPDECTYSGTGV